MTLFDPRATREAGESVPIGPDDGLSRFSVRANWLLIAGMTIVVLSLFLAVFGEMVAPYDPERPTGVVASPPSADHWFGTDATGLDIFSRVITAPRTDVSIAIAATTLSVILGTVVGLLAGFYRGWWSEIIMRVSDVVQSFPVFILAMILVALSGRSIVNLVVVLAFLYTPIYIRLTRAEVLAQRHRSYVESARALGNSELTIALRHVLPNSLTPSLIQASVTIGWGILLTAGLSFIGAGVRPPTPEWGLMIATGSNGIILGEWWPSVFPGIGISFVVFGYAAVGNALERRYAG